MPRKANRSIPTQASLEKIDYVPHIVQPMNERTPNTFGYYITGEKLSGPIVASVIACYRENEKSFAIFSGETEGIPSRGPLYFTGSRREVGERVIAHIEYIAQELTDSSKK